MRRLFLAGLAMALFGLPALAAEPASIAPFKDSSRIVAIGGSLTEIVFALGEEGKLVARDTTGNYPPAALKLPDIGYMRALSPEGVLSVAPTGILAIEGSGPPDVLSLIEKSGVPFEQVPESFSGQGIIDKVLAVGHALGADDKAGGLAGKLKGELAEIGRLTSDLPSRKRVLFVLSLSGGKIMAAGTDTAANAVIGLAGAVNATAGYAGYKALTDEAVIAANPDAVLVMDNAGDGSATASQLLANPAIALTPAGRNKAVIAMDGEYLLGFGPRTPAALRDLVGKLYGDRLAGK
jgi:iron complex transport system substrate-binding protein